jgi:hypothetical protein
LWFSDALAHYTIIYSRLFGSAQKRSAPKADPEASLPEVAIPFQVGSRTFRRLKFAVEAHNKDLSPARRCISNPMSPGTFVVS